MDKPKKRLKRENRTEWSERVVAIQRVTKVVKGGKKMSFRAIIVVGNEQGKLVLVLEKQVTLLLQ